MQIGDVASDDLVQFVTLVLSVIGALLWLRWGLRANRVGYAIATITPAITPLPICPFGRLIACRAPVHVDGVPTPCRVRSCARLLSILYTHCQ